MGFWGYIYAIAMLPALLLCFQSKQYRILSGVLFVRWVMFIAPVRFYFEVDQALYATAVTGVAAAFIYIFSPVTILSRVTISLLGMSILLSYSTLALEYVNLRQSLILSEVVGYILILALYGGGCAGVANRVWKFPSISANAGFERGGDWFHNLPNGDKKPATIVQMHSASLEGKD